MNFSYYLSLIAQLSNGVKYTVGLFAITAVLSIPIGLILAFIRAVKNPVANSIVGFFVWIMRGTPLLLQLFFIYYVLPSLPYVGHYLNFDRFLAASIAFVLNYSAYFCEIFRGGLLSVDKGQYEAAKVLGFSSLQTSLRIVIPQMLRVSLPTVANECITLVKDTSLGFAIGVTEGIYFAKNAVNRDVDATAYLVAAAFYLFTTFILTKLFKYLEEKFKY